MRQISIVFWVFFILCIIVTNAIPFVYADTANDLQSKIDDRNAQIKQLEDQLKEYTNEATVVSNEATTLKSTLKTLDITQKKLSTDLSLTQNKIVKTSLTIDQLGNQILQTKNNIDFNKKIIADSIQKTSILEDGTMFEMFLSGKNIAEVWDDVESIRQVQNQIKTQSDTLHSLQTDLTSKQDALSGQKKQLTVLKEDLSGKAKVVEETKTEKAVLLTQTQNKEIAFQQLIQTTAQKKAQFEKEVYDFESQLKLQIDPNAYPAPQHGILSWPVDTVRITQLFGKTVGAEKLYVSGSHNGVDFGASIGTRVKNVLDGVVVGTGNTDIYPGCYSFGKWVMVKHGNGLSTIYGHLSVISASQGQQLATGDLIGYSGNTGYSTGPHLHISVYATQGVRIEQFVNSRGCKQAIIPLADIKAYLDPMVYFPSLEF